MQQMYHIDLCLVWFQVSFYLAQKYAPDRVQAMKLYYEDELARA